jgi:hypothetical protein
MIEKTKTFLNRNFPLENHISCRGRQGISRPPSNLAASTTLLLFPLEIETPPLTSCFCLPDSPHFALQALRSGVRPNEKSGYLLVVRFIPWKKSSHVATPSVVNTCQTLPPTVELAKINTSITTSEPRCPEPSYSDFAGDRIAARAQSMKDTASGSRCSAEQKAIGDLQSRSRSRSRRPRDLGSGPAKLSLTPRRFAGRKAYCTVLYGGCLKGRPSADLESLNRSVLPLPILSLTEEGTRKMPL